MIDRLKKKKAIDEIDEHDINVSNKFVIIFIDEN